jgi:hypothetical protein
MIIFKEIELGDRAFLVDRLAAAGNRDCNLSFVNLFSWQFLTEGCFAVVSGVLVLRFMLERSRVVYLIPSEEGRGREVVEQLLEEDRRRGDATRLFGEIPRLASWLDREFPGQFDYQPNRDYFDYVYARQDLVELRGKYLQAKRNHVNKFRRLYTHEYVPLTPELVPECLALEEEWCRRHADGNPDSLLNERRALTLALRHMEELQLLGGALRVNGKLVAFAYGAPITGDTFGVHIEKADASVEGAYNMINQEFARRVPEQYSLVNREEDLGLPGLRKAKLSYHPRLLLEKGVAEYRP